MIHSCVLDETTFLSNEEKSRLLYDLKSSEKGLEL